MAYEQITTNLAKTTLTASYTAGAGSLTVGSTANGTVSGYTGAFPANPTFRVAIIDQTSGLVKALLKVTAVTDSTHWATAADIGGFDANAASGDIVAGPWITGAGLTQVLQDTSNYGAEASAPTSVTGARLGQRYLSSDAPYERIYDGAAWKKVPYGALVLLEQHTASSSATLDFTTCLSSAFDEYQIHFVNVLPATDNQNFNMRLSTDGGATYDSSANYYWDTQIVPSATSVGSGQTLWTLCAGVSNSVPASGVNGASTLFGPGSTASRKNLIFHFSVSGTSAYVYASGAATWTSVTAVNAFRFLFASGNIASGIIRCYGVSKGYTI